MIEATADVAGTDNGLFLFTTLGKATDPAKLLTEEIWQTVGSDERIALVPPSQTGEVAQDSS